MTYKDFLEEQILRFEINWEERRIYIREHMDLTHPSIPFINPFKYEKKNWRK